MIKKIYISFLLSFLIFSCGCSEKSSLEVGDFAKDFQLETLEHQRFYLNQQKGKTTILIFWATWCNICKEEMIAMQEFLISRNFTNMEMITICHDPENFSDLKEIKERLDLNFLIILDKGQKVSHQYGVKSLPVTFIIDKAGKIVLKETGYNEFVLKRMKKKIIDLVGKK